MKLANLAGKLQKLRRIQRDRGFQAAATFLLARLNRQFGQDWAYRRWYAQQRWSPEAIAAARAEVETWAYCPTISILTPVYNIAPRWLERAIASVQAQVYPYWQLCLADDASPDPAVRKVLARYAAADPRVQVAYRDRNGGISAASNSALELATGDFIALLDHDDELAPQALYAVARLLQAHPDADFIYSDEDRIDERGRHYGPSFKPDWSPDYLHSQMYTCHLGVYRAELVRSLGGFRSEYDGPQDYDLVLRLTETTARIYHIPQVLYHWRSLPSSTASGLAAKPWSFERGQGALQAMLERAGDRGRVETTEFPGVFRVRRALCGEPLVSIVIPSAGKKVRVGNTEICLLERCIASIKDRSTYRQFELVLVDGWDIPEEILSRLTGSVELVRDRQPFNFARRINLGVAQSRGEIVLILNDDTEVLTPDWLEAMLEFAQLTEVGAVGAKLLFPNGKIQHAGVVIVDDFHPMHAFYGFPNVHPGYGCSNFATRNYWALTGACLMLRRSLYDELGGMDEAFPLNYNDVDLCLKAHQAGYRNVLVPYAELSHWGSASRSDNKVSPAEREQLRQKWADYWQKLGSVDPYYNPNFNQKSPNFEL